LLTPVAAESGTALVQSGSRGGVSPSKKGTIPDIVVSRKSSLPRWAVNAHAQQIWNGGIISG
jgi:hypothetical protein